MSHPSIPPEERFATIVTAHTDLVLTGSEQHFLEGFRETAHTRPRGSGLYGMYDAISHVEIVAEQLPLEASPREPIVETDQWTNELSRLEGFYDKFFLDNWPMQELEFLARTLAQRPFTPHGSENEKLLLVGTPIYVALAD